MLLLLTAQYLQLTAAPHTAISRGLSARARAARGRFSGRYTILHPILCPFWYPISCPILYPILSADQVSNLVSDFVSDFVCSFCAGETLNKYRIRNRIQNRIQNRIHDLNILDTWIGRGIGYICSRGCPEWFISHRRLFVLHAGDSCRCGRCSWWRGG